jgi:hypothetical protein
MGQQVCERNRRWIAVWNLETGEIGVDVCVEVNPALLVQLHDCRRDQELGDRPHSKECAVGIERDLHCQVGVSVSSAKEDVSTLHDGNGSARDSQSGHLGSEEFVRERADGGRLEAAHRFPILRVDTEGGGTD